MWPWHVAEALIPTQHSQGTCRLGLQPAVPGESYYSFSPHAKWRFICLDSFDVSTEARGTTHPNFLQAVRLLGLAAMSDLEDPYKKRFVPFSGGVGEAQLQWLQRELQVGWCELWLLLPRGWLCGWLSELCYVANQSKCNSGLG